MGYEERKRIVLGELEFARKMSFQEVEKILDVAPTTVRRDLARMSEEGLLIRFHGGVKLDGGVSEYSMHHKQSMHSADKREIGRRAAELLSPHELVFIGGGSTTLSMIEHMTETTVSVITNSVPHAEALHRRGVRTFLLCGFLRDRTRSLGGTETIELMRRYRFDKCFVGAGGIGSSLDILSADSDEHDVKVTALSQSGAPYVLVDASKFGLTAMYSIGIDEYPGVRLVTNNEAVAHDGHVLLV